jgi:hypothetical protein
MEVRWDDIAPSYPKRLPEGLSCDELNLLSFDFRGLRPSAEPLRV